MLASLLSKATAVTLPGLLLLLDVWPLGRLSVPGVGGPVRGDGTVSPYPSRPWQMVILEKLPLMALSVGFAFFQIVASQRVLVAGESLPLVSRRLPNALYAFDWYLVKTVWPTDLHPAHTHFGMVHPAWLVALCGVGVLATVTVAVVSARRHLAVTVGLAWFAAALVPVIGLVPVGIQSHSDRFAYIPHIGLFIALVWGGATLAQRLAISPLWMSIGAGLVLAAARADRMDDALAAFGRAIDAQPACAAAHNNAGLVHSQQHDSAKAIAAFRRAITLDDTNADYHVNLAAELSIKRRGG